MQDCRVVLSCAEVRCGVVWCKADYLQEMRNVTGLAWLADKTPDTTYQPDTTSQMQDRIKILITSPVLSLIIVV